jgi:hypothetical protein
MSPSGEREREEGRERKGERGMEGERSSEPMNPGPLFT